ncbi:M16 family metallopeptidase [Chitinimonas naiadis]
MKRYLITALLALAGSVHAGDFRLPEFERYQLKNGLTVYLMERHDVPLIAIRAVVKTGGIDDGKQAGLASLTQDGVLFGSTRYSKQQIDEAFDFRGGRLAGVTGTEQTTLSADFARDDAPTLLPMFADLLQRPSFPAAEVDKLKARTLDNLKQMKEQPRSVVRSYFQQMLFGNAPYGNAVSGTASSVAALGVQDLKTFHQTYYRPDLSAVVVVGDFKRKAMREQLDALFGGWRAEGALPKRVDLGKVQADKARVWLVNKSNSIETTFLFGGAGIARNDPDYVPLQVINTVLGGRFTSWLNDELRVNSGLTYGANSGFSPLGQTGTFAVSSFTALPKTDAALALATKTYQRLWAQGIDAATLESAKAYVKGQFPPRYETSLQLAGLLGDMYAYGFGREQIDNFSRDVDGLTPERASQLISKHFPRERLQMVLIGKADDIKPIAAKYGEVTTLDIKAEGFGPL